MRITDSYCEDLAVIIIYIFQVNAVVKNINKLYIKRKTLSTTGFFSNREQDSTDISKVFPLTEVNINQEVE